MIVRTLSARRTGPGVGTRAPEIEHRGVDPGFPLVRETPAVDAFAPTGEGTTRPDAPEEPVLDVRNIQGNVLAGFNKDFASFIFLVLPADPAQARGWLAEIVDEVATTTEVKAFNELFKLIRRQIEPLIKVSID